MKNALSALSWLGLALTLVPSLLLMAGSIDGKTVNLLMAIGMVLWFVTRVLRETMFAPTEISEHAVEPDPPHTL